MEHVPGRLPLQVKIRKILANKRVVLLGVGNPDRGDDGLGPALVLQVGTTGRITSIVCDDVPENYTGQVRAEKPEIVIFVDAIDFGARPGEVVLLKSDSLEEKRFNTHRPSLAIVMNYLLQETGAEVWLLGVQPASLGHGGSLTLEIRESINQLATIFRKIADEDKD